MDTQSLAFGVRGNEEIVVAMHPYEIGRYCLEQWTFHGLEDPTLAISVVQDDVTQTTIDVETPAEIDEQRSKVKSQINRWVRDSRFRCDVMAAYDGRCAVCGLDIGLPQAAHIIPVARPESTDEVTNGLALCPTHHIAYDKGLLSISPDFKVVIPESVFKDHANDSAVISQLGEWAGKQIRLPNNSELAPDPLYLEIGVSARGFSAS